MTRASAFDVVTGAYGFSGAAISGRLLAAGRSVRTLTNHPNRAPAGTAIEARPLDFADPTGLVESMRGADTLYNTYWVRFPHGEANHDVAVANSRVLFDAAARAGVRRVVHVSITHPAPDSPYDYFRGKALVEQALGSSGVGHAIVRPAILFGPGGVLINNIAYLLRKLPVFAVGGDGSYRVRAIHVDDLADLCVTLGAQAETVVADAVGPDRPTFREIVQTIRTAVGSRSVLIPVPAPILTGTSRILGCVLRDTLLTGDEYHAMADGLADSAAEATGVVHLREWIAQHGKDLGRQYAHELRRHYR
jgi:NADH dehydrogenase